MRILLTGASSMTGARMAAAAADAGIEVHATLRNDPDSYQGMRGRRIARLPAAVQLHGGVRHGDASLGSLISMIQPDVLAYHAHPMVGFRGADYDYIAAVAEMTATLGSELDALAALGASVVFTGTVYEPGPLSGPGARPAVSPYGISKRTVFEALRLGGAAAGVPVHGFVLPNPFGPLEEGRFGNHLAALWGRGETPVVRTPNYIRDNIPVAELAARFVGYLLAGPERAGVLAPSGYIESQGRFAERVAREMGARLGRVLPLAMLPDAPHPEPLVVTGDGVPSASFPRNEERHWDEYAEFLFELMKEAA